MAEPLPNEDQDPAPGFQYNGTGEELAARLHAGGTKTIAVFTAAESQPPETAFATLDTRNSIVVLDFDDTTTEATTFVGIIPEGAELTSGIIVAVIWAATSATSGSVRWKIEFANLLGQDLDELVFDSATEANSLPDPISGVPTHVEITCIAIAELGAMYPFLVRISRVANDTTNDTMVGDAELIAVELRCVM